MRQAEKAPIDPDLTAGLQWIHEESIFGVVPCHERNAVGAGTREERVYDVDVELNLVFQAD